MIILDTIRSKIDKTVKFVLRLEDGLITEVAYIDKDDGKDILCVSTQTGCNLGCRFCHTTDARGKVKVRNLDWIEIHDATMEVDQKLNLQKNNRILLVSYMGCGEPLLNANNVLTSMVTIKDTLKRDKRTCRFAIATLLPKTHWQTFFKLVHKIPEYNLDVKIHLSLHFVRNFQREEWMPAALKIGPAITALEFYRKLTGQSVEIHYALIEGINDTQADAERLGYLLRGRDIPVKLLKYNKRESLEFKSSERSVAPFQDILERRFYVSTEYYDPPGSDVGASCGEFLLDYYLKYNKNPRMMAEEAAIGLGLLLEGRKDSAPVHLMVADSVLRDKERCQNALKDARRYRSSEKEKIDELEEVLLRYHKLTKPEDKMGLK